MKVLSKLGAVTLLVLSGVLFSAGTATASTPAGKASPATCSPQTPTIVPGSDGCPVIADLWTSTQKGGQELFATYVHACGSGSSTEPLTYADSSLILEIGSMSSIGTCVATVYAGTTSGGNFCTGASESFHGGASFGGTAWYHKITCIKFTTL